MIEKDDFATMDILGQLNLGFIVVRLRRLFDPEEVDGLRLFIVHQHAADENYNFEPLHSAAVIQMSIYPLARYYFPLKRQPLELSAEDERSKNC